MANYTKVSTNGKARQELHAALGLTGAEVSINSMPAGAGVPFVHAHKLNEEIYFVTEGSGKAVIDGEEVALAKGDWVRVAPEGKRQFFAGDNGISYICIQVKAGSLEGFTADDAIIG